MGPGIADHERQSLVCQPPPPPVGNRAHGEAQRSPVVAVVAQPVVLAVLEPEARQPGRGKRFSQTNPHGAVLPEESAHNVRARMGGSASWLSPTGKYVALKWDVETGARRTFPATAVDHGFL